MNGATLQFPNSTAVTSNAGSLALERRRGQNPGDCRVGFQQRQLRCLRRGRFHHRRQFREQRQLDRGRRQHDQRLGQLHANFRRHARRSDRRQPGERAVRPGRRHARPPRWPGRSTFPWSTASPRATGQQYAVMTFASATARSRISWGCGACSPSRSLPRHSI